MIKEEWQKLIKGKYRKVQQNKNKNYKIENNKKEIYLKVHLINKFNKEN